MGLVEEVRKVLAAAGKLKGPAGNEANTKALLIEPMLAALGWDVTDVDHVVREWRVFDNTALDYALKIDDAPALYVEARGSTRTWRTSSSSLRRSITQTTTASSGAC